MEHFECLYYFFFRGYLYIHKMNPEDMERIVDDLDAEFKRLCDNPSELKEASQNLLDYMIDELTMELIFETHRAVKTGLRETIDEPYNEEEFVVSSSTDEKQQAVKKAQDCPCPICNRVVSATRFAPHLENCMGMGRKRSRNASRMVTNNNNKERETSYGGLASDDEDDWNFGDKRKKKKTNNRVKKSKNSPKKNGEYNSSDIPYMNYDNMSEEEKKNLLNKYCGVVSEHTKKICSRSLRCALHSDEKRRALRTAVICDTEQTELVNVDIEGDDDMDSASLRDLLQDNSNTSSPADSASNSNSSSSSKKREKSKNSKNKNSKKERSSPTINVPTD